MTQDLDLSLSLGPQFNRQHQQQQRSNFINQFLHKKPHWTNMASVVEERGVVKGIDVNRTPAAEEQQERDSEEEEAGVSSPNSTVSSVMSGGKRDHQTASNNNNVLDENDMDRGAYCSRDGISDEDDADGSRKKLRLSKDQSAVLEESFKEHNTLNPKQKLALAKQLNLRPRQVEVWFQNRRARTKLKQTEVDCEFLKRCCENLTEENRRLQKEVQELRALKLSPQLCMHMTPPTTLTMCPSCERISSSSSSTTTTSSAAAAAAHNNHHHHQQHRPMAPNGAPWAPIPLRATFLDSSSPMQRS